ncbi:unnamed protein product [Rotaria magnacalcarata]|uniref:Uncharacterized protein n=3 Tax=Rotaria magnacalcarata TaxID=392030 RepID=A0A8S2UAA6_9BILA|nr:unnamed protein product [Rotaria magnacalcarata]CAF4135057.1 unnamed protein product [Rotaria magnacalcarata]CAF4332679.1 unnamed protein product [Rotaria magnacalcarata]
MASTNIYEKHYFTKSRANNDDNLYVLILFKSDNTFVIKKKSNLHSITENGLVTIKDRNKSYVGYCLCEGSLTEIEAAADRLDKEMNTDLESDCEIVMNFDKSNASQELSQCSMLTTPSSKSNIEIVGSSAIRKNKNQKKKENNATGSTIRSLLMTSFDNVSSAYQTLNDIQRMTKDKTNGQSLEISTSDEDIDEDENEDEDESDDDNDSLEERVAISNSTASAKGSKSKQMNEVKSRQSKQSSSNSTKLTSNKSITKQLCGKQLFPTSNDENQEVETLLKSSIMTNKDLAKDMKQSLRDIKHLSTSVEKLDTKVHLIFENQKKIQRALAKRKINVALLGGDFSTEDQSPTDVPFKKSLDCEKSDGTTIDLLQLYGVRTQIGRFVALVMDQLFTKQQLCTITKSQLVQHKHYETIKEAVRSRFKLNKEEMNFEWPTIHESILQKRRNEKKRNVDSSKINTNKPPSESIQTGELFDSSM